MRRADIGVSQPQRDDRSVDSSLKQGHRAAVPEDVRVELLGTKRRASCGSGRGVFVNEALDGVGAEVPSGASREQWFVAAASALPQPDAEDCLGSAGQRNGLRGGGSSGRGLPTRGGVSSTAVALDRRGVLSSLRSRPAVVAWRSSYRVATPAPLPKPLSVPSPPEPPPPFLVPVGTERSRLRPV